MAMRTLAYLRVSTGRQDLGQQKLAILDYARQHRITVDDVPIGEYAVAMWTSLLQPAADSLAATFFETTTAICMGDRVRHELRTHGDARKMAPTCR